MGFPTNPVRIDMLKPTSIVSSVLIAFLAAGSAQSAPITLAFEAEIVSVFDTVPFDAGVSFEVGDKVTGRFSFEPDDVGGGSAPLTAFKAEQATRLFVSVNGVEFSTPDEATGITIQSFNDSSSTLFGEIDSIRVGSAVGHSDPALMPRVSASRSGLNFFVEAPSDVLPGAVIPADPATWNQLHQISLTGFNRNLNMTLRNDNGGTIGFAATLVPGSFALVPEPVSATLVLPCAVLFIFRRAK